MAEAELRQYTPTWRDLLAQLLMGDERPSMEKRNLIKGLLGSSGIGSTGTGLVDMTAPGAVLGAQESLQQGHPGQAVADMILGGALPGGRAAGSAAKQFVRSNPGATASMAGGAGALLTPEAAGEAAADPKLTRAQQREMEMKRQQAEIEKQREIEAAREKAKIDAEAAATKQAGELKGRQDLATWESQQRREAAAQQAKEFHEWQRKPFNEKYPTLAEWLPAVGALGALGVPYASKLDQMAGRNTSIRQLLEAIKRGDTALNAKGKAAVTAPLKTASHTELTESLAGLPSGNPTAAQIGFSAALPAEAALVPSEYNTLLPTDSPERQQALDTLTSPSQLASRTLPSIFGGAGLAGLGAKAPSLVRSLPDPTPQAKGLIAGLTPKPSTPRTPRAKKEPKPATEGDSPTLP